MRPPASPEEVAPVATDDSLHPRAGVSLHLVDDEGVLLDAANQNLYRANTTAAFIWCCIEDGASRAECAVRLRHAFETSDREARSYVAAAIDHWRALHLLAGDDAVSVASSAIPAQVAGHAAAAAPPFVAVSAASYRLLDTDFRLRFASHATAADMEPFLTPLTADGASSAERVAIDVHEDGERRALYCRDRLIERWAAHDELVPVTKIALVTFALERSCDFGALHAGAVCRGDGPCVVIAGASGVGKSTLVAALAAGGFRSLGDDTVVLARDTLAVRAIPFGICLKEGAWTLLPPPASGAVGSAGPPAPRRQAREVFHPRQCKWCDRARGATSGIRHRLPQPHR